MDKELRTILNNCLKEILKTVISENKISRMDLMRLIQIIYNEIINEFNDKETYALILSVLSCLNDLAAKEKPKTLKKETKFLNEWKNLTNELTDKNSAQLLNNILVERNKLDGEN